MSAYWEFTGETKEYCGCTLKRIRRISDGRLGGWIEKESNLQDKAFVYGNAIVYGNAEVYGNAVVRDNASIYGNAIVCGNANVCGNAIVRDCASVYGNAEVFGNARVYGNAKVFGNAVVYGSAVVRDNASIYGNVEVYGNTEVYGNAAVCGNAKVCDYTDYISIFPIGSRAACLTAFKAKDKSYQIATGCFVGSFDEFEKQVKNTHGGTDFERDYLAALNFIRIKLGGSVGGSEEVGEC